MAKCIDSIYLIYKNAKITLIPMKKYIPFILLTSLLLSACGFN